MKRILIVLLFASSFVTNAQIITTIAGTGTLGDTGDGDMATVAEIYYPFACTFDTHGNFYFTEVGSNRIRKINTAGIISTYAGQGSSLGDGGLATAAQFSDPTGIAVDASDNLYIADLTGYRIRKIDAITDIITTIAGNGSPGYSGDNGPASAALIDANNVCIDGLGNVYILDGGNFRIRKINTSGIITTAVGNGIPGYSGDGGQATAAEIEDMSGICTDVLNNLYFTEDGIIARVRKVTTAGIISTIAGNGSASVTGDGGPATAAGLNPYALATDKFGNLYISGYFTGVVRKVDAYGIIHTVAGNGTAAFGGDGEQATAAELYTPIGIALDTCGNLFIADRDDNHIRKVTINPSCIDLSVGNVKNETAINVYPNPAYDYLKIDNLKIQATYDLLNIVGVNVRRGSLKAGSNSTSLQQLSPGMYMLEILNEDGEKMVRKVIKE